MTKKRILTPGGCKLASNVHFVPPDHCVVVNKGRYELHHNKTGFVRDCGPVTRHPKGRPLHELLKASRTNVPGPNVGIAPQTAPAAGAADVLISGWSSYATWLNDTGSPIARMQSTWVVPPEPANTGDQLIYIFNGMENETMILQPVLQWGTSPAGGGQKWSIANWYADSEGGHSFYSALVDVQPGQVLTGMMLMTGSVDGTFNYSSAFDVASSITMNIYGVDELTYAAQTIEAYKISSQDDMPSAANVDITNIQTHTVADTANVVWSPATGFPHSGPVKPVSNTGNGGEIRLGFWQP